MVIVGLQCGHDASVAVLADGRVLLHLERERDCRLRHVHWMTADLINDALAYCGLSARDVDLFALCATQSTYFGSETPDRLRFDYTWETAERVGADGFRRTVFDRAASISARASFVDDAGVLRVYNCEWPDTLDAWTSDRGMRLIDDLDGAVLGQIFNEPSLARINVLPMAVTLDGRTVPAIGVMHHLSHAAAAFYQSGFETAAVLSHDNGSPRRTDTAYNGGMLFYGEGTSLRPIWTAPIPAGRLYSRSARWIGLGGFAGPGKLMGLSAYGRPALHDPRFVGDVDALADLYINQSRGAEWSSVYGWFKSVEQRAEELGYRMDEGAFSAFGKDLAASAQQTFEDLTLYALERLRTLLAKAGRMGPNLCLSGGSALNCPTNSRIVEETEFTSVFVPPSCDDGGLSIGAALYVHHHMLGHERIVTRDRGESVAALGRAASASAVSRALDGAAQEFDVERGVDLAERAAEDLAADRVVALFQGRAESGPRALGHRSLLADPRPHANWERINTVKSREWWRPFAPACLQERLREHFDGGPADSLHMLFNYRVRSKKLGAVTHVDGSARAQTVRPGSGPFRQIIEAFDRRTGIPVVLNTSLNGPGEPIVETPDQAIEFLRRPGVDVLYVESNRLAKRRLHR